MITGNSCRRDGCSLSLASTSIPSISGIRRSSRTASKRFGSLLNSCHACRPFSAQSDA